MKIENQDYIPLNEFILKWRFTDPQYNLLPDKDILKIHPLCRDKSNLLFHKSTEFTEQNSNLFIPNRNIFGNITELYIGNTNIDVRIWLNEFIPKENESIIISWQPDSAVLTEREIFIKYWNDFCYAGSDDVSIFPNDETWLLHYWHEECFYFAKRKSI